MAAVGQKWLRQDTKDAELLQYLDSKDGQMMVTHLLWQAAGQPAQDGDVAGICRVCGQDGRGLDFESWVRPTFTDHDKLQPGDIICQACQFAFAEASEELQARTGKDEPQRMRNYSHIVTGGEWHPLSKGAKDEMRRLILQERPELVILADSGQKHIIFRATMNDPTSALLRIQFEEQAVIVDRATLVGLVDRCTALLSGGFSKAEIASGDYAGYRILKYGRREWRAAEDYLRECRGSTALLVGLFLAQKEKSDGGTTDSDTGGRVAGAESRVQKPLPDEHLAAIRGPGASSGVHVQPEQVRQLALFQVGRDAEE